MAKGIDPGEINAMRKAAKAAKFEVWEENWQALSIFLRCQTQWRTSMAGVVGLDYTALAWLFRLYAVEDETAVLEQIQVIESVVLRIMQSKTDS